MSDLEAPLRLVILAPVFNDWETARLLLQQLDVALTGQSVLPHVLFLDDCSTSAAPADLVTGRPETLVAVESLRLRRNLGHQRAIAIGLSFIHAERPCDAVLIMDADGEDKPEDVPRLLRKFREEKCARVIFAERIRRSEDWVFRAGYLCYRGLHWLLTGVRVRVGNFSVIPRALLETLVVVSETWNHYAAAVFKSKIPFETTPAARGKRLAGKSSMNYVGLVLHGLSAISVFAEIVGVRLTLAIVAGVAALTVLMGAVLILPLAFQATLPAWALLTAGLLLIGILQMLTVALGLTLLVLFNRNQPSTLPIRDYRYFIGAVHTAYER